MNGFINVNKAPGMTSFEVIKKLRKIWPKNKMGHLGTLDPNAVGVLPVAVGFATRLIEYVSETGKVYRATMTLGGVSDTQDAWGNITYKSVIDFKSSDLNALLEKYTGNIMQTPPMYSAVHHNGIRLYELARQGITVDRVAREVEIQYIKVLNIDEDGEGRPVIALEVACSKGTYIRTLCHDLGQGLGTGAYLSELQRIRVGVFTLYDAYTLEDIQQYTDNPAEILLPMDYPLQHLPLYTVDVVNWERVLNGNRIAVHKDTLEGWVRIYDPYKQLTAMARCICEHDGTWLYPVKVFRDKNLVNHQ